MHVLQALTIAATERERAEQEAAEIGRRTEREIVQVDAAIRTIQGERDRLERRAGEAGERLELTRRGIGQVESGIATIAAEREGIERRAAELRESAVRDLARADASLSALRAHRERAARRLDDERERLERIRGEADPLAKRHAAAPRRRGPAPPGAGPEGEPPRPLLAHNAPVHP